MSVCVCVGRVDKAPFVLHCAVSPLSQGGSALGSEVLTAAALDVSEATRVWCFFSCSFVCSLTRWCSPTIDSLV